MKGRRCKITYSVGIYARLSVDDGKNESIESQIEIAKAFIAKQSDMVIFDCYTDIGKTGTNFEREGFERMMGDVRMGNINCIIVKDLSRFGRNHIETGNYIEKIFPFMGVRFIAVTDNFDSMYFSGGEEAFGVNLKNLVNEMYARDISVKIKSGKKARWEQGSFTGGVAPYGYKIRWSCGKKSLAVEEGTADIVKEIFDRFLSGRSMKEIIVWLYEERILRPTEYHRTGKIHCLEKPLQQWSRGTVKGILTNPVYMGCLDYHSLRKEHTHEAIVSEESFFQAAESFERLSVYANKKGYSKSVPVEEDIFAGVLYCGECGRQLKRITAVKQLSSKRRSRTYSYHCPNIHGMALHSCITKSISLSMLSHIVQVAIRQECSLSPMRPGELVDSSNREMEGVKDAWNGQLAELERKMENIKRLESEQYLNYRSGKIDEQRFRRMKEEKDKKLALYQKQYEDIAEKCRKADSRRTQRNYFWRTLVKGNLKSGLTPEVVRTLIHRVEVYPDYRVRIVFAFKSKRGQLP